MEVTKTRKRYNINYYELNTNSDLKESVFMLFLQDIATDNAEQNGFGYTWAKQNNLGWFLLKYHIEFTHYPKNLEYIEIETVSRGFQKLFAYRDFSIFAPNGEQIGKISSLWALIDMNTKSMVSPVKFSSKFSQYQKKENDTAFKKIFIPTTTFEYEKLFDVRFDDLDINHHVNNTNYISWALESLPYKFRIQHSIKNLDIQFKKEISINNVVSSKAAINNLTTVHMISDKQTGDELALLSIDWE